MDNKDIIGFKSHSNQHVPWFGTNLAALEPCNSGRSRFLVQDVLYNFVTILDGTYLEDLWMLIWLNNSKLSLQIIY